MSSMHPNISRSMDVSGVKEWWRHNTTLKVSYSPFKDLFSSTRFKFSQRLWVYSNLIITGKMKNPIFISNQKFHT